MAMTITPTGLNGAGVLDLIAAHTAFCTATSPRESCHFLDASGLDSPDVTLWAAREGGDLLGIAALKRLPDEAGEIKSMHTAAPARGRGVADALLTQIETSARARHYTSLWLETGSMDQFAPARALYERHGFEPCAPFGDYKPDPNSAFYSKQLTAQEAS
ncbi:GNAT family N-acetyltransferase [Celeribacter arenosi]|uniref:GNAT family N-acetyltransferase n=1 Tax=Celeribacter arenosi TaxID=792649 RepID=A0ABP7K2Z4_9RHOB